MIEPTAKSMSQDFAIDPAGQMPQISASNMFKMESL
jgi:hypothetical protein